MKIIFLLLMSLFTFILGHGIKGFDDTVLFDIKWPGNKERLTFDEDLENMVITTAYKEKYKCYLPNIQEKENSKLDSYDGPSPLEVISPLFRQSSCSYRLESYWTYEVCHGRFIRQYHEDREGKKVKVQEYYLGRWDKSYHETLIQELKQMEKENTSSKTVLPVKKIDGFSLPYFEVTMSNGTSCELNQNKPRETKVVYVCYVHGKHEIFSLKEISTCVYEVIILSPLLCAHPKYKPQQTGENQINCLPLDNHPPKPRNLMKMNAESLKMRRRSDIEHIRVEFHPIDLTDKEDVPKLKLTNKPLPTDSTPVENFLSGKNCLNGGTGWWKYEFCYGKSVEQYHMEKTGKRTSINLGIFNKPKHLEWISSHPHKRPKPIEQRNQLSHLYSDGTVCDKNGKPRQTEVKLKCLENSNMNAISLYLLEPRPCEYILGVESPLICDILAKADENGLVEVADLNNNQEDSDIPTIKIIKV